MGHQARGLVINSDTSLTVTPPAEYAGTVDITVTTPGGTSADSSTRPIHLPGEPRSSRHRSRHQFRRQLGRHDGHHQRIGFSSAYNVYFGTVEASNFVVNNDDTITAISPSQAAGTVNVTVDTYNGNSTDSSADRFSYSTGSALRSRFEREFGQHRRHHQSSPSPAAASTAAPARLLGSVAAF